MLAEFLVEKVINEIALSKTGSFYPTLVAKRSGLPLSVVFEQLLKLVQAGKLTLNWEIRCPVYGCDRKIKILDKLPEELDYLECMCGQEIKVTPERIFPVFQISRDYKTITAQFADYAVKKKPVKIGVSI
jgi:hypothetical protein